MQKRHSLQLKSITENCEAKIKSILEEKQQNEINLNNKIKTFEEVNSQLKTKFEENLKYIHEIKRDNNLNTKEKSFLIKNQEEEIEKIKKQNSLNIISNGKEAEEEKAKIIYDYEKRIQKILEQFDDRENKYDLLIKDKENEIQIKINKKEDEIQNLIKINEELLREIDYHKQNIISQRNKRIKIEDDITSIGKFVEKLRKDLESQDNEIRFLEKNNNILCKENVTILLNKGRPEITT